MLIINSYFALVSTRTPFTYWFNEGKVKNLMTT